MKKIIYFLLLVFLSSCSTTEEIFDEITAPDYVSSSKARRLEVPPDLSELDHNEKYSVPGEAKSYKEFLDNEKNLSNSSENYNRQKVISNPEGMKIVKSGVLRWLVVEKDPDIIWPHIKDFWEELGFRVLVANKRTGIIETEWMDTDDLKLDSNAGALSTFDKWLDSLSGFSDKRKFRTRVEYGPKNTTEIYVSQRSAAAATDQHSRILSSRSAEYNASTIYKIEEYKSDSDEKNNAKIDISESRKLDDYEIDSELLTRLMIKLGATDFDAREKVNNPENLVKATLAENKNESHITLFDPYDRSWRRLGLALDIIGFITEDKNRSEGIYFVRFGDLELPAAAEKKIEEKGIIDKLIFWDDEKEEKINDTEVKKEVVEEDIYNENDEKFSGIEAPEVKPLDEDFIVDENKNNDNFYKLEEEEETWLSNIWPAWGDEDTLNIIPDNEKRFRVRIKPVEDNKSMIYLDYPNGKKNNSSEAKKVLQILYEHLR